MAFIFGDDDDGLDFSAAADVDVSGGGDIAATISDAAQTVSQVAKVATTGAKIVGTVAVSVKAIGNTAQQVKNAQSAIGPHTPPAVVAQHAANIVAAAQQHVRLVTPPPAPKKVVKLKLPPSIGVSYTGPSAAAREAEPFFFGLLGGGSLGGLGWWLLKVPGAIGGGVLGVAAGAAAGLYLARHPRHA
jgi:hypothetical protein